MIYYYPMYQTSIKMFKDSKILGKGLKVIDTIVMIRNL